MLVRSPRASVVVDERVGSGVLVDEDTMPVGASRMLLVVGVCGSTVEEVPLGGSSVLVVG
jgi:hypothetical protein